MQQSGDTHQTLTFRLILAISLIILFILTVSFLGQQAPPSRTPTTVRLSPSPTPSRTPPPTATRTPTPTLPPPTSALAAISLTRLFTLGQGTFSTIARSPDGRLIATIADDMLKWFDAETYEQLGEAFLDGYKGEIVTFSPDSRMIAFRESMGGGVFDLQEQGDPEWICGGNFGCRGLVFSPDGRYVAYTSNDSTSGGAYLSIGLWDVVAKVHVVDILPTQIDFRPHTMSYPAFSADSHLVSAGHSDGRVYVWNTEDGEPCFILEGHAGEVESVDFSPDGRYLASGSADGTVRLWSPSSGQLLRVITGLLDDVTEVKFTTDSRQLRIVVREQAAQIYNLDSGQLTAWEEPAPVDDPFAPILFGQGYVSDGWVNDVTFSPDGKYLVVGRGSLLVWDVETQELVTFLEVPHPVVYIAYSPDGKWFGLLNNAGEVMVWDTSTWALSMYLSTDILGVDQAIAISSLSYSSGIRTGQLGEQGFAFSPDSANLAVGVGGRVEIWEIQNVRRLMTLQQITPPAYITRLAYSEDGKHIYAALNSDSEAVIWDTGSGVLSASVDMPASNPDGYTTIVRLHGSLFMRFNSDLGNSWVDIWDPETGELILVDTEDGLYRAPCFSPNGSLLFTVDNQRLYVWLADSGDLMYRSPDNFGFGSLAFSPDNSRLAIGADGIAEVWDISGIADRAQGSYIPTVVPQPTNTPWADLWVDPTPMPDIPVTLLSLPQLPEDAISPANAAQVVETGHFGAGRIEQVSWVGNSEFVVAGAFGVTSYTFQASGGFSGELVDNATGLWAYSAVTLADGRSLAAGSDGKRVQVWDLASGETLADLEGGSEPALSPNGRLLVYVGEDNNLHTWDVAAGQPVATLLAYARRPVFSPDSKLVAAVIGGWFDRESVRVWDVTSRVIVNALGGPDNAITDLSFSPDGRRIVAAAGGSAWVWDIRPGQPVINTQLYPGEIDGNLTLYVQTVTAAALSPNGWTLAVGTSENTINLYSLGNQSPTRLLSGHSAAIEKLAFSPDGRKLLSLDADGAVLLWNVSTGVLLDALYSHYGEVRGLVFQENGSLIGWQAGTTWTFNPAAGEVLHTTQIFSGTILAVSPLGDWLAATHPYVVSLWDAQTGEYRQTLGEEAPKPFVDYRLEGLITQGYFGAAFNSDGARLVTLGSGGIDVYDVSEGTLLLNIPGDCADLADISLDTEWLITTPCSYYHRLGIYDIRTGGSVFDFPQYMNSYLQYQFSLQYKFSPDNRWVGLVNKLYDTYQFHLWDFASHTLLHVLDFSEEIPLLSLAFSPDGRLVALGQADGQIFLVDLSTFQVVATLSGHRGAVERLAFSPDGRYLASGGQDGTIRIWGVP